MFGRLTYGTILQKVILEMAYRNLSSTVKEQQVNIAGQCINYIKTGSGSHSILCFPGALGTIWSDFKPQIENLDKNKFTIVAWDPPGYGSSRPPNRKFTTNFYEDDADVAYQFMKEIGINKFSLLGWSDGGISSMFLAFKYPDAVQKLVIWGSNVYFVQEDFNALDSNINAFHNPAEGYCRFLMWDAFKRGHFHRLNFEVRLKKILALTAR